MKYSSQEKFIRCELLRDSYNRLGISQAGALVNALVIVLLHASVVSVDVLLLWLVMSVITVAIRLRCRTIYLKRLKSDTVVDVVFWERVFQAGVILSAVVWASAPWLLFTESSLLQLFMVFIIAGVTATAVTTLSPNLLAVRLFLAIILFSLSFRLLLMSELEGVVECGMVLFYGFIQLQNAKKINKSLVETQAFRYKNLEQEKKLLCSERKYQTLFEGNADAILLLQDKKIVGSNEAARKLFGCNTSDFFLSKTLSDLSLDRQLFVSEVLDRSGDWAGDYFKSGVSSCEWNFKRVDGRKPFIANVKVSTLEINYSPMFQVIISDISELKLMMNQLQAAKDTAERAAAAKSEFLANMSHELRTPMSGIMGMLQLARDVGLDRQSRQYIDVAMHSAQNLLVIINDILDFSKIEANKLDLESIDFSIKEQIVRLTDLFQQKVDDKALTLTTEIEPSVPEYIMGDPVRVNQVLANLLSNAIKFTDVGGSVSIRVQKACDESGSDQIRFYIRDSGIGMTVEQQSQLFQAFTQADSSTTRKYGGTGLGLAISHKLAKMMKGEISVSSKLGEGSCFCFSMPAIVATELSESLPVSPSQSRYDLKSLLEGKRILLAEDNDINQLVIKGTFRGFDVDLVVCANGREALQALSEGAFDAVLMDCQMPVMDGYDCTRHIRNQLQLKDLPVIALTANAMEGDKEKVLEAGMDAYIAKPFSPQEVLETLGFYLSSSVGDSLASTGMPSDALNK